MVVPWSEIPARKWAKVGKQIAAHEFCKRLSCLFNIFMGIILHLLCEKYARRRVEVIRING